MINCKEPDVLANEIYSLASILKVCCEKFGPENHEIACIRFLADYLCHAANDLAKTY